MGQAIFRYEAGNPIIRAVVRSISFANRGRYRLYYVPGYRCFMYLNLSEPLTLRRLVGQYERSKMELFRQWVKEGMAVVDVGANLGDFTFVAAKAVGPTGKVVAFEPDPQNIRWLTKSVIRNGFKNIEVRQEALSVAEGTAPFFLSDVSGWHSLKGAETMPPGERASITVQTRPLDALAFDRMDVVKVDVEGAEYEVLCGAERHLKTFRPLLFVDLHASMGADVAGVTRILHDLNYKLYGIGNNGRLREHIDPDGEIVGIPPAARQS